jgi:hypothetical protein
MIGRNRYRNRVELLETAVAAIMQAEPEGNDA